MSDDASTVRALIPAALSAPVQDRVSAAASEHVAQRLRNGDGSLWGAPEVGEVANRLGWLTIAQRMLGDIADIEAFAEEVRAEGITDVVLLGMGGSSLAPEVLRRSFGHTDGYPVLHVLDSTDAGRIASVQAAVELSNTLFIVSSKSGGTIEPLSLLAHFWSLVDDGRSFVAITDPGSGLAKLARERSFRRTFLGDPDIGGRYSALSPFGVVPAALMGIDVRALLEDSAFAWETSVREAGADATASTRHELPAGVVLGAGISALALDGRDKLTFIISPTLPGLGLWLEQLVAESTGKHGKGILPVADEPLGDPSVYGEDRVFAYVTDTGAADPDTEARVDALAAAGHPVITIPTAGPGDLGRAFLLAELAVAVAGWGLQINPFDQPNVQQAKDATARVLAGYESSGELPAQASASPGELRELLLGGVPPDYVAIMAYLEPTDAFDEAAEELRAAIRDATRATTTFGYGPRFLHSTGQFHKGGPRTGRFLQLLHDAAQDIPVPGARYSFTTLKQAQAIGDLDTLRELGLPAEAFRLQGEDPVGALRALTATIKENA